MASPFPELRAHILKAEPESKLLLPHQSLSMRPVRPSDCLQARNEEALCFKHLYGEWEQKHGCKVITSTRDTFEEMFDSDDTLTYEPSSTAAIILTGNDEEGEEAEKAAAEVGGCSPLACVATAVPFQGPDSRQRLLLPTQGIADAHAAGCLLT